MDYIISIIDAWIRQYLSTSPAVEKEDFVQGTKAALVTILEHPKPLKSKFPNNKPLKYCRKQDGFWRLKNDQGTQDQKTI